MKEPKYKFIDIHKIEANGHQPRTHFENEKIQELAVSIQQNGLLQPIVVRPYHGKYQIVVGERRYRACLLAGIEEVPCLVQNYDEQQTATAAIVENIQRENLSAIEEALAYQQILDTQNITQEELAQKVGISQYEATDFKFHKTPGFAANGWLSSDRADSGHTYVAIKKKDKSNNDKVDALRVGNGADNSFLYYCYKSKKLVK